MTADEKLLNLKIILFGNDTDTSHDVELGVYLDLTKQEVLNWKYSLIGGVPENVTDVLPEDEITQIMACAAGYGHKGAPDQKSHNENGINRTWKHADMVEYVRSNVIAFVGLGG